MLFRPSTFTHLKPYGTAFSNGASLQRLSWLAVVLSTLASTSVAATAPVSSLHALKQLSVEALMDIEVTSVSKRPEKLSETASAIQVIPAEQIRRSGALTLPQALRLATNLQTAQVGSSNWTVGARGFNARTTTSNKLLVMLDGRSVYSPLFSGTFWDTQDVFLPDVDRIEVISGPGGATWGTNAVNGVINVLTKSAEQTQGTLLYGGTGDEAEAFGGLRQGGRLGQGHYRVYAKSLDFNGTVRPNGADSRDRYVFRQAGFRFDSNALGQTQLTFQGDVYGGFIDQPTAERGKLSGGNLLGRWTRGYGTDSQIRVQTYYDYAWRWASNTFADRLETFDVDAQHRFGIGARHRIVWGLNYRSWIDHVRNTPTQAFFPADDTIQLAGIFAQDEIELSPDHLRLTIGAKLEHNDYSGSDYQPNVRLAWLIDPANTLWAAVSRAVRTPSRFDRDFFQPPSPPFVVAGGPDFSSEVLWAYELGWRSQPFERLMVGATLFYHDYDDLRSLEPGSPLPFHFANGVAGRTQGGELTLEYEVAGWWRWNAGYTTLRQRLHMKSGSRDLNQARAETSDPEHQFQLRTAFDLPKRVQLDLALRRIDTVPTFVGSVESTVPAYTELDARAGWWVNPGLEVSVTGHNLLHARHPEAGAPTNRREIERSISGKVTWSF